MDLRQLQFFLAVAQAGQITAAAGNLHMAQPPLSHRIKQLEEELGVELFVRGPRGIRLTGAGELLKERAEQVLGLADSAKKEVMHFGRSLYGALSIGAISSSGGVLPNAQMIEFARSHPNIRIEIHEGNTFAVLQMLEKGVVELGIVRTPFARPSLGCRYAPEEPMAAVFSEELRGSLGDGRGSISLAQLAERPLIIYRRFDSLIREAFAKDGAEPLICCENDDARTTMLWARAGLGIGIVPRSAVLAAHTSGLAYREIDCVDLVTRTAVVWVKNRYLSDLSKKFVELFEAQAPSTNEIRAPKEAAERRDGME
jgi:DNA-binding transcriptional LysR family regulator